MNTVIDNPGVFLQLTQPKGVADDGRIVGIGYTSAGVRGFLLTPILPYKAYVQPPIAAGSKSLKGTSPTLGL